MNPIAEQLRHEARELTRQSITLTSRALCAASEGRSDATGLMVQAGHARLNAFHLAARAAIAEATAWHSRTQETTWRT